MEKVTRVDPLTLGWVPTHKRENWPKSANHWSGCFGRHQVREAAGRYYVNIGGRRYTVHLYQKPPQEWQIKHNRPGDTVAVLAEHYPQYYFGTTFEAQMRGYPEMIRAYEQIPPRAGEEEYGAWRPMTQARSRVREMRVLSDGAVEIAYWQKPLIRLYPDKRVWIGAWSTVGEATSINECTPRGIGVYRCYDNILHFVTRYKQNADSKWDRWSLWSGGTKSELVQCPYSDGVMFRRTRSGWAIDNPDSVPSFIVHRVRRDVGRKLSQRYNIADMKHYVRTIDKLLINGQEFLKEQIDAHPAYGDPEEALLHMERREFDLALRYLEPCRETYFGYQHRWGSPKLTEHSVEKARRHLYEQMADEVYVTEHRTTIPVSTYEAQKRLDL